jgi:cell division protein FtsW
MKETTAGKKVDKLLLSIILLLTGIGLIFFISASLGVLARSETKFYNILFSQLAVGLVGGMIAFYLTSRINYKVWRRYAFFFLLASLVLSVLVFVPGLGFEHGGATRWISLGFISFQPAELLKVAFIIYFASWLSAVREKADSFKYGLLPFIILMGVIAVILLRQPDTKSLILMFVAGSSMFFLTGVSLKKVAIIGSVAIAGFALLAFTTPYLRDRVKTFMNPDHDPRGSSYQLKQALIAVGSGGISGRGIGQSVQKFNYLPEPQGDSIFAVISEETGFVGSLVVILLYAAFAMRGLRVAARAPDAFGRLLATGIIILLTAQSFLNIASILGLFPLTGVPLVFMSQGGTSLLISLAAVGMVLNISRFQKKRTV